MKEKITVVVCGTGFVGAAVAHGFQNQSVILIDPKLGTHTSDIELLANKPDVIFICVPTPTGENGDVDVSIVSKVLRECNGYDVPMVLKSTVPPNYVKDFARRYEKFVYNPEFLTERNALWDFENPISNVYGGKLEYTQQLEQIYKDYSICKEANTFHMTTEEASFVKYGMNSFLSTKVLFFNQLRDMAEAAGCSYEMIRAAIVNDTRIGSSHTHVPGNDGRKGFGSACFSKDVPAFIHYSFKLDKEFTVLKQAWNANCDYRNSYGDLLPRESEQHVKFNKI